MKKISKIIAIISGILLILGLLYVANAFVGNPISKMIVTKNAVKYIEETYINTDYYVDKVTYSFKTGGYYANIKSPSSEDTYFSVSYNMLGDIGYDRFPTRVADGFNTWERINSQYRKVTDDIIANIPYESDIAFGEIETIDKGNSILNFGLDMSELELDKNYDIAKLGSEYGNITIYVYVEEVTAEKAREVLLEIKNEFEKENQSFYAIDLVLRNSQKKELKDWQDEDSIRMEGILYTDIVEDGLLEKIETVIIETKKYYDEMDKKEKEKEMEQEKNL